MHAKGNVRRRILDSLNKPRWLTAVLIGPILTLFFSILLFPFLLEIYLSYTPWHPRLGDWWNAEFIGVENYVYLLTKDPRFLWSLARTGIFVIIVIFIEFGLGLLLATLFTRKFRFGEKRTIFTILLLPMMMMPIIVGYNFYMIFQPRGPLNYVLGLIIQQPVEINWLNEPLLAWIALIVTDVWHWTPFMFLILLSGLISLPQNPIDAAKVLGATSWQIFKGIQLPMLRNIIIIALVIRAMEAKNFFDELFIMTRGGPGTATENISMWTYQFGAVNVRIGFSSAGAIIILITTVLIISLAVRPIIRAMR